MSDVIIVPASIFYWRDTKIGSKYNIIILSCSRLWFAVGINMLEL